MRKRNSRKCPVCGNILQAPKVVPVRSPAGIIVHLHPQCRDAYRPQLDTVVASDNYVAKLAAKSLIERFERYIWYQGVGVGEVDGKPTLYLYVDSHHPPQREAASGWEGFPVIVKIRTDARPIVGKV